MEFESRLVEGVPDVAVEIVVGLIVNLLIQIQHMFQPPQKMDIRMQFYGYDFRQGYIFLPARKIIPPPVEILPCFLGLLLLVSSNSSVF